MLAIKYTPNIFLISVYVSSLLQQDICYVKVYVLKNWKQLFLSKLMYWRGTYETSARRILDPRNSHEKKIWTHEIPTKNNFRPTKYPGEEIWNPRNTCEKKHWTHEISTRKNYGTTKAWWYDGTRPTMARDPRNLAHSVPEYL